MKVQFLFRCTVYIYLISLLQLECNTKASYCIKAVSTIYLSSWDDRGVDIPFPGALTWSETQIASSKIWTLVIRWYTYKEYGNVSCLSNIQNLVNSYTQFPDCFVYFDLNIFAIMDLWLYDASNGSLVIWCVQWIFGHMMCPMDLWSYDASKGYLVIWCVQWIFGHVMCPMDVWSCDVSNGCLVMRCIQWLFGHMMRPMDL